MEFLPYLKYLIGLVVVLGLIGLAALAGKRFGLVPKVAPGGVRSKRIKVIEVTPLDARRRFVLIRHDDREHLVLIGGPQDLLIDSGSPAMEEEPTSPAAGNRAAEGDAR
jgi:flagellar protein FliO/FliZ